MNSEVFKITPLTHKQLAALYSVLWPTMQKWIRPIEAQLGQKIGNFYNARQVTMIIKHLGPPYVQMKLEL